MNSPITTPVLSLWRVVALSAVTLVLAPGIARPLEPARVFPAESGSIYGLRYFPDGKRFAYCAADDRVTITDVETAKVAQTILQRDALRAGTTYVVAINARVDRKP